MLDDATIPAQTPIPRKDILLDTMSGSTQYSAIDLMGGVYQVLVREDDVSLMRSARSVGCSRNGL
ncbi:hypothetical protein PI125_g23053 [Phytophthora idaei]|nr:hypothetical protein PI125_g23053 [Phytophthora idaei]KAG3128400.1 hypothetical protein PI126_g21418 [Phytophthora idaei]